MKTPKRPNFHQEISLRRGPKHGPEQPKAIGLECNPITTCFFHSMASIDHISLVYTLNCDLFEALKVAPILTQSWHNYADVNLKTRTSKKTSFSLGSS